MHSSDFSPYLDLVEFNPKNLFTFAPIQNWLLCRTEVSTISKVIYARLLQYANKNGIAYPKVTTMSRQCGISVRVCERALKELKDLHLIYAYRNGMGKSNTYIFYRHPWMEESLPPELIEELDRATIYLKDGKKRTFYSHVCPKTEVSKNVGDPPYLVESDPPYLADHIYRIKENNNKSTVQYSFRKKVEENSAEQSPLAEVIYAPLPFGFKLPQKWEKIAIETGIHPTQVQDLFDNFCAYWNSNGISKKNWTETWLTQCRFKLDSKSAPKSQPAQAEVTNELTPSEAEKLNEDLPFSGLRQKLLKQLSVPTYRSWIDNLDFESNGSELIVYATNLFIKDYVSREFDKAIKHYSGASKINYQLKSTQKKTSATTPNLDSMMVQIDKREPDLKLRAIRKKLCLKLGDSYMRLFYNVELFLNGTYLKIYTRSPAHRSFIIGIQDSIQKALEGEVSHIDVSIGSA